MMAQETSNPSTSQSSRMPLRELPLDSFIHNNNSNSSSSSSSPTPNSNSNSNSNSSSPFNKSNPSALARKKMRVSASTQSSNTPPTIKHQSDLTLHSGDDDGLHSKGESGQQGQGGNPVGTETEASDAEKDGLSIHQSNNLLHKGTSPISQKQRTEGKKAFLKDQDQEEEEKLDLLRGRGVGQANVGGGSISSKHQQDQDGTQGDLVESSENEPAIDQDPDSTFTIKSLSSSPRRGEDQYQSEQREKEKEHSNRNSIQKDGDFVIFRDSEEISDSIMKGGNPFESTSTILNKGKGEEVLEDDEITDENQKPDWLIDLLESNDDSKVESNLKRIGELNRDQDQASSSSPPHRKSSKSKSDSNSSSSPSKHNQAKEQSSSSDSDPTQVQKEKGKKSRLGKVEERSEVGKGQSSSSSSTSIIETRAQKKRKVTPKISVQTQ